MKSFTIALATAKETIRQPAFFVMAVFAGALLIGTIFVPYFTFGEDIKMYKDTGLTTISFFCMLLALLTASSTVAEEIEGKTAILITHRFTTAMHADVIHVMDKGRIIESGSHAQLVTAGGAYATSWAAQMREIGHDQD